jgi:hypothetical protein
MGEYVQLDDPFEKFPLIIKFVVGLQSQVEKYGTPHPDSRQS